MPSLSDVLDDLALLISRAEQSVEGRTFDDLIGNDEAYEALTYRLEKIGETCQKLPDDIEARHPHLFKLRFRGYSGNEWNSWRG